MTTLISWKGVDAHGVTSIYIASDSRVTFSEHTYFDNCRKVMASAKYPLIFGYCGDVTYPLFHIGAILSLIDSTEISCIGNNFDEHCYSICSILNSTSKKYLEFMNNRSTIIFAEREFEGANSVFKMCEFNFIGRKYIEKRINIETSSPLIFVGGSGANKYKSKYQNEFNANNVSREVFWSLCSFIESDCDKNTGGSPQLAGLFKKGPAISHYVIWDESLSFCGTDISSTAHHGILKKVQCVNRDFELCDPITKTIKKGAQRQPVIKKNIDF